MRAQFSGTHDGSAGVQAGAGDSPCPLPGVPSWCLPGGCVPGLDVEAFGVMLGEYRDRQEAGAGEPVGELGGVRVGAVDVACKKLRIYLG